MTSPWNVLSIRGRANHHELEEPVLVDIYKPAREPIRLLDSDLVCYNGDFVILGVCTMTVPYYIDQLLFG